MLALSNQYCAILDACVLAPMPLCDTLLRLAEEPAFHVPKWSSEILNEVCRTIEKWGYSAAQAQRRINAMTGAFEDATVTGFESLIDNMGNHSGDRHVLAAAVKCGAHAIVTENLKHFPAHCLQPFGIEAIASDDFLIHQFHFDKGQILAILEEQAARAKKTLPELLKLISITAPSFSALVANSI